MADVHGYKNLRFNTLANSVTVENNATPFSKENM